MAIVPGQVTNSVRYDIPNPQSNDFMSNMMQILAYQLAAKQQRENQATNQMTAIFPTLAAQHMIKPGTKGAPNTVQYGNMPWEILNKPGADYGDLNAKALYEERTREADPEYQALKFGDTAAARALNDWSLTGGRGPMPDANKIADAATEYFRQRHGIKPAGSTLGVSKKINLPASANSSEKAVKHLLQTKQAATREEAFQLLKDNGYI